MKLYALRNVLDKQPLQITAAIMAWVNLVVIADLWNPGEKVVGGFNAALIATLLLFVSTKTTNTSVLNELAADPPTIDGVPAPAKAKR